MLRDHADGADLGEPFRHHGRKGAPDPLCGRLISPQGYVQSSPGVHAMRRYVKTMAVVMGAVAVTGCQGQPEGDCGPLGLQWIFTRETDMDQPDLHRLVGDEIELLTHDQASGMPSLSPDGSRIAYTQYSGDLSSFGYGDYQVYVMDVDGSDRRPLADESTYDPVWSPDGRWIAYQADLPPGDEGDGRNETRLVTPGGETDVLLVDETATNLTWSYDSTRLASASENRILTISVPDGQVEEIVIDSAVWTDPESGERIDHVVTSEGEVQLRQPVWTAYDTAFLTTVHWESDMKSGIYRIDPADATMYHLPSPSHGEFPMFPLPDGRSATLHEVDEDRFNLLVVDADGRSVADHGPVTPLVLQYVYGLTVGPCHALQP
ncbi:WD40 repeat protein [Stackebrandtia albiflava]|uniref:WD40 repeat protein n=2 Tax=Stackebrandtia albiflava TaxID=406432 RepID=A0A562ULG1_9ACTN|nr:WD40 repeat protein [Stackebrandtia albiflava]